MKLKSKGKGNRMQKEEQKSVRISKPRLVSVTTSNRASLKVVGRKVKAKIKIPKAAKSSNGNGNGHHVADMELKAPPLPKYPPVMAQQQCGATHLIGPFCEVRYRTPGLYGTNTVTTLKVIDGEPQQVSREVRHRIRSISLHVRVYEGDERNGKGIVMLANPRVPNIRKNQFVRWAGGTAESPATLCDLHPVSNN